MSLWSIYTCEDCYEWRCYDTGTCRSTYIREYKKDDVRAFEELPGIDIKNGSRPTKSWHNRLNLNTPEGESRFLGSVKKELSKKGNIHKLQTSFQVQCVAGTELACKTVWNTNQSIALYLSSPIQDITCGEYIKNNLNKELAKDIANTGTLPLDGIRFGDGDLPAKMAARPSVIALNLKWKPGITLSQGYTSNIKETQLEPLIKKTEFNYETKTKFGKEVESVCEELFPDWRRKLMILDGNDCHHGLAVVTSSSGGAKIARSDRLMEEESPYPSHEPDPFCRKWREYRDLEEHKILVVPSHSRSGFGRDLRYQLPYQIQFVIGRRTYSHKVMLELPVTRAPQHYGLIFKFSEDPLGHTKLRVKSLLSVYCIFPVSPKRAYLRTYEMDPDARDYDISTGTGPCLSLSNQRRRKPLSVSGKEAIAAVKLLSDNLKEDKLIGNCCLSRFGIDRDLTRPAQDCTRYRRLYRRDTDYEKLKQKKKKEILRNIKMERLIYDLL